MINSFDNLNNEDDYPIIFYQPYLDSKLPLENNSIHSFLDLQDVVQFARTLRLSFLFIIPDDFIEEKILQYFQVLENTYPRRLADFEEESIKNELSIPYLTRIPHRMYVFYTRQDFEDEVLTSEDVEKMMNLNNITEVASGFREEYFLWEIQKTKQDIYEGPEGLKLKTLKGMRDFFKPQKVQDCKEFCIRALKDLARKRKREKLKMIYYINMGHSCEKLIESKKALEFFEKVLGIIKLVYGESHLSTATSYTRLASVYQTLKEFPKALDLCMESLQIRKSILGESHPKTASAYCGLGRVYRMLGEYQEASEYSLKALEIRKSIYGEFHLEVSDSYSSLGMLAHAMGQYRKASEYYIMALDIEKSAYGDIHPSIAVLYNNLAETSNFQGKRLEALEYRCKALEIRENIYGKNHPSILTLSLRHFQTKDSQISAKITSFFSTVLLISSNSFFSEIKTRIEIS